ncbi:hypothetical protein C723_0638 [Christiangramia flava JLT2011]|uniref:Uncharacterized protein n=1 Tax=Christiangramia flava JLT2011 TaxID=1229726 RepID=A0A1L7I2I6_9FLAO|nr:hypothetical protein GRFL_1103 [Christiangramia flava JLT2011]OSS40330.1 hypothetical protein C723_0638 [Christiangramia flava JLT2011]
MVLAFAGDSTITKFFAIDYVLCKCKSISNFYSSCSTWTFAAIKTSENTNKIKAFQNLKIFL